MEIDERLPTLTEVFDPTIEDARPGFRMCDLFGEQIIFDTPAPPDKKAEDPEDAAEKAWEKRKAHLDKLLAEAKHDPLSVVAAVDAAVPKTPRKQAVAAALIYSEGVCVKRTRKP